MKGKRAKINSILLQFDFEMVRDVIRRCDITWTNKENEKYVPTVQELKLKAEQLLRDTTETNTSYCKICSGGFMCRKTSASLELLYVIEAKFA